MITLTTAIHPTTRVLPSRPRATWADVGCSRFALLLLALNMVTLALGVGLFQASGLALGLDSKDSWAELWVLVPAASR